MKTNKELKIVGIIVAVILLIGGGFFLSRATEKEEVYQPTVQKDVFRESYMEGCISEDASYAYCDCSYEKLKAEYGMSGFVNLALEYDKTGNLPDKALETVASCFNLL